MAQGQDVVNAGSDEIKADIERTRADMDRTLDELAARLAPAQILNRLLERVEQSADVAHAQLETAVQRQPAAVLGAALGVGVVLGLLAPHRRRRPRYPTYSI